ncbi:MAG: SRPBCC family protein [Chloroflexi bacterium]|nr:SRPBCC family protein [Chloroflexota bacterium]
MPQVQQSVKISVPVEKVFSFIADQPERMVEWWPPIELQERLTPPPTQVGSRSRYQYNMIGIKVRGEHEVMQFVSNQRLYIKTLTGLDSAFDFQFEMVESNQTQLTVRVEYMLPGSVLGRILDKTLVERENVQNLEVGLANLKRILEQELAIS